MGFHIDFFFKT